mmetsp:Transcript_25660/g.46461  ORF Transcript_25660/g.46461 Transcript_25660/m.46461 type:complete len:110 (-) Transcript_25660:806-1135(-)
MQLQLPSLQDSFHPLQTYSNSSILSSKSNPLTSLIYITRRFSLTGSQSPSSDVAQDTHRTNDKTAPPQFRNNTKRNPSGHRSDTVLSSGGRVHQIPIEIFVYCADALWI